MDIAETKTELNRLADHPALAERRDSLLELSAAIDSTDAHYWAKVDLFDAFGADSVHLPNEDGTTGRLVWLEWARNIMALSPLLWTWFALYRATDAYAELLSSGSPSADAPFIALWQRGFDGRTSLTLSRVALVDALLIVLVVVVSALAGLTRRSNDVVRERQRREIWNRLREALTWASVHLAKAAFDAPARVSEALGRSVDNLRGVTAQISELESRSRQRLDLLGAAIDRFENRMEEHQQQMAALTATAQDIGRHLGEVGEGVEKLQERLQEATDNEAALLADLSRTVTGVDEAWQQSLAAIEAQKEALTQSMMAAERELARVAAEGGEKSAQLAQAVRATAAEVAGRVERSTNETNEALVALASELRSVDGRLQQMIDVLRVKGEGDAFEALRSMGSDVQKIAELVTVMARRDGDGTAPATW